MDPNDDDGFEAAFKGFGEEKPETPPTDDKKPEEDKKEGEKDANKNQPASDKPDDVPESGEEKPAPADGDKPTDPAKKPEEDTPPVPETPQPLTKDDVASIIRDVQMTERASGKELEDATKEVLDAYHPDGLSNVLVDQKTGRQLKTPQDVVDVSDGELTIEQAASWLMNKQFELDRDIAQIKEEARKVAETTLNFKRDSIAAIQKYEPLFKWQPHLQEKAYKLLMGQVRADKEKGVVLSAPDVIDLYDTYLEPYQKAFEFSQNKPATNPLPEPEPAKPGLDDRIDDAGDGGASPVNDPNDFAQQVKKELAKEI